MAMTNKAIPVQTGERIQVVDVLRGFAILGILLMNMRSFSGQSWAASSWVEPLDRTIVNLIDFFAQAKFYSLFSFLFGWGMAMQFARAEAKGIKFIPLYMRRLIILFIFGGLHSIFLWTGDILTMYALLGMVLLLVFSRSPEKILLIAFAASLIFAVVMTLPGETMTDLRTWCRSTVECLRPDNPLPQSLYVTGTYAEVTQLRFQEYLGGFWWVPCYFGSVLGMMLLGYYVGKRKIFENIQDHLSLIKKTLWIGLAIGLPLNGVFVYRSLHPLSSEYASLVRIGARTLGAPALTLAYIAAIILIFQHEKGRERLAPLSYVGRMALSNYIAHSVIAPLIFYGYGLGLYGETDPTFGLILTIIIYLAQVRFSQWWFVHYQYGPLEWLWRTLSYGMQQPFSVMSSYESLKNLSPKARIQRSLILIGIAIFVVGAVGLFANRLVQDRNEETALETPQGDTVAEDNAQSGDTADVVEPEQFILPDVQPVNIIPGPIAASGDLETLAETFNAESALLHIERLASNTYLGRYAGSPSGHRAGDYISQQFARYGLQPVGDDGGYFQTFSFPALQVDGMPTLSIMGANGISHTDYQLYQDFKPVVGAYAGAGIGEGDVVWMVDCTSQNFHGINAVGKIVFCRDGNVDRITRLAVENGAAGLLLLTDPAEQAPAYRDTSSPIWIPEPIPVFHVYPDVAQDLLAGSGYSIADLSVIFNPLELRSQVRMEVSVAEVCDGDCLGRNVVGVIPGSDPAYADQVIIVGANYDHVGRSPEGVVWPGANDNASGTAVLLEIAHSWQEQAYVPSVTTLFVAWDAREQDSLGARHYIKNPIYPLEKTIAVIELSKLGAGGDIIQIDGEGLAEQIEASAKRIGIESIVTNELSGDHRLLVISWTGGEDLSHLPEDTSQTIQLERLQQAGQLADLVILGLAEGPTEINELLVRRSDAILNNDLASFLSTSTLGQKQNDELWFNDVQLLEPISMEMKSISLKVAGNTAHALIRISLETPAETDGETRTISLEMPAQFEHNLNGWQWAGPDLVAAEPIEVEGTRFTVHHSADRSEGLDELGQSAVEEYIRITDILSLSSKLDAQIYLYSTSENLRADTSFFLNGSETSWVAADTLKFVDGATLGESEKFKSSVSQLILANAGIPHTVVPWLWEGLPLVLEGEKDQVAMQVRMLPSLQSTLALDDQTIFTTETSWAAVEYLRQKIGWDGLGRFITALGRACQNLDCETDAGLDQALTAAMRLDSASFNIGWRQYWQTQFVTAQTGLDAVLAIRTEAVLNKDERAFLSTVDQRTVNLLNEEKAWFADLSIYPPESFGLTAKPLAFLDDGSVLASVKMEYQLENVTAAWGKGNLPITILFTPSGTGYRWAGPLMQTISGNRVRVRYPIGEDEFAQALLADAESFYAQLASEFNIAIPRFVTINLYDDRFIYRSSVALSFPAPEWAPGWSAPGQSVKILSSNTTDVERSHYVLVYHLSRQLLQQIGVEDEWLLSGVGSYLSRTVANGVMQRKAAGSAAALKRAIRDEKEFDLNAFPSPYRASEDEYRVALAQAWDSVRYLAETYGEETLLDLINARRNAPDLDSALRSSTGLTTLEFASAWKESFNNGHLSPADLETALSFDGESAQRHIEFLTSPELAGRQAGSPGSVLAAEYIAESFAASGLQVEQQLFPVRYQTYLETPTLNLTFGDGSDTETFIYREDFLVLQNADTNGSLTGEMVWVADETYNGMNLEGKVVVRNPSLSIADEIMNAQEHGAMALILVGDKTNPYQLLAKFPFSSGTPQDAIPVLELTAEGFNHFLEATGQSQANLFYGLPATFLNTKADLRISLSELETVETANVIGLLPGTDPNLSDEMIVISAHYDYVGDEVDTAYRGANDNASGVAVLLEIARLWQDSGYSPKRSVLFIAFSGQELGESGSNYYVENPLYPLENIVGVMDMDAVGGGDGYYLEAQGNHSVEGILLSNMQRAGELTGGRLQTTLPEEFEETSPEELFSPDFIYDVIHVEIGSDDKPFRQAGIPTLLLRWQKSTEDNLPDAFADEVLPERLVAAGKMIAAALMMLAR